MTKPRTRIRAQRTKRSSSSKPGARAGEPVQVVEQVRPSSRAGAYVRDPNRSWVENDLRDPSMPADWKAALRATYRGPLAEGLDPYANVRGTRPSALFSAARGGWR